MAVLGDAHSLEDLKDALSPGDLEKLAGFQQRLVQDQVETDKAFGTMFERLCHDIRRLDGEEIARRLGAIDDTVTARRESLAASLLGSLSQEGAERVMQAAEAPAKRYQGSFTDVPAIAARFPAYVKDQYTQRCVSFGYIKNAE
jgi:hypothetical protein